MLNNELAMMSVESLPLSIRAKHTLSRMRIKNVGEFLATPLESVAKTRSAGVKTVAEIQAMQSGIAEGRITLSDIAMGQTAPKGEIATNGNGEAAPKGNNEKHRGDFTTEQLVAMVVHSLDELNLSTRSKNALTRAGIANMAQLVALDKDDLRDIRNLGGLSLQEIERKRDEWLALHNFVKVEKLVDCPKKEPWEIKCYQKIVDMLRPIIKVSIAELSINALNSNIRELLQYSDNSVTTDVIDCVLRLDFISEHLKKYFLNLAPSGVMYLERLESELRAEHLQFDYNIVLDVLSSADFTTVRGEYIYINWPSVEEYVARYLQNSTDRNDTIFLERLNGKTLEEIGQTNGMTRERVRQIVKNKISRNMPMLHQVIFRDPFRHFCIAKNDFCKMFPSCGELGYEYLSLKYKKGKLELNEQNLAKYHDVYRERLERYLRLKNERLLNDKMTRLNLTYMILKGKRSQAITVDEFYETYNLEIDRRNLSIEKVGSFDRTLMNYLRNSERIVFDQDNRIRYCVADAREIWQNVDFERYQDMVISSELIFRDYRELMEELDIRDGYELFYVIKSSLKLWDGDFSITCRRVPTIVLGQADDAEQSIRLLEEISPINQDEYYKVYEAIFGVKALSARGNPQIAGTLKDYLVNGTYVIDVPTVAAEDEQPFKEILDTRDIWFIEDLERSFKQVCQSSSRKALNTAALNRLGYTFFSETGYAYNSKYGSFTRCLEQTIFAQDIIRIDDLDKRLLQLGSYLSSLTDKKEALDYIEAEPRLLVKRQIVEEKYGISLAEMLRLQEYFVALDTPKYFNLYSTREHVTDDGIKSIIAKLRGNDWLANDIVRQNKKIFSRGMANGLVLSKTSFNDVTMTEIARWLVENHGKMPIRELCQLFNDTFGITIDYKKFADKMRASGVWDELVGSAMVTTNDSDDADNDWFAEEFF